MDSIEIVGQRIIQKVKEFLAEHFKTKDHAVESFPLVVIFTSEVMIQTVTVTELLQNLLLAEGLRLDIDGTNRSDYFDQWDGRICRGKKSLACFLVLNTMALPGGNIYFALIPMKKE